MRNFLMVAAFAFCALLPGLAQRGGHAVGAAGGARSSVAFRSNAFASRPMVQSGPVTRAGVRLGTFGHPCCFGHGHRHFRYFAWYPWWYSYSYYPYYWSYYSPMANYGYSDADEAQSQAYNYDQQISNEIGQLQDEVESLREELRSRSIEAPAPPAASPAPTAASPGSRTPTVLVYRDGHTREITNYAIVGPTLWVLSEQRGQKVALAELDIPATIKTNDERGVEFQVPTSR